MLGIMVFLLFRELAFRLSSRPAQRPFRIYALLLAFIPDFTPTILSN